jgi:hypothetical protein
MMHAMPKLITLSIQRGVSGYNAEELKETNRDFGFPQPKQFWEKKITPHLKMLDRNSFF